MTSTRETLDELLARMRLLEIDHEPEGWPAVQMREITALCDEIERLRAGIGTDAVTVLRHLMNLLREKRQDESDVS